MKTKYYNDAIIGNRRLTASYSKKGELLRLYYPTVDYKEFIEYFETGVKVNDSNMIYLHDDVNNVYHQYYTEDTNILNTEIKNTYFNLKIDQIDFIPIKKDVLMKKYTFCNEGKIDLEVHFLIHSKLLSNINNMVGARICDNSMLQYSHDYTFCVFSNKELESYQLNDTKRTIGSGKIVDKDYIGMASDSSICYDIGLVKPGEKKELSLYIMINHNEEKERIYDIVNQIDKIKACNISKELAEVKKYWKKYVATHHVLELPKGEDSYTKKLEQIYKRSILLFPLLTNEKTGGVVAALEVDEKKDKCGRYSYCWPRDSVTVSQALDMVGMYEDADHFYRTFLKNTQSKNGMWEQRFYTDGRLAPCWGYQIDETASIVFGLYQHFKIKELNQKKRDMRLLKDCLKMCENAVGFLQKYVDHLLDRKEEEDLVKKELEDKYSYLGRKQIYRHVSYDLWEMHEGVHLYSLAAIYAAFRAMIRIYEEVKELFTDNRLRLDKIMENTTKLEAYMTYLKQYVLEHMYDDKKKILHRNTVDDKMDISMMGAIIPFFLFEPNEKKVQNTVEQINLTLRTYTGGYLRFEGDSYMGGRNPWPIATLWMYLYYKIEGKHKKAEECLKFVVNTATEHGFLAEQVDNEKMQSNWVIGLAWSHAMFILALGFKKRNSK